MAAIVSTRWRVVGLPIVIDGELNPDIVHKVSGNVDPIAWVLSANLHRRHLTKSKRRTDREGARAKPNIGSQAQRNPHLASDRRQSTQSEATWKNFHVEDSTDTKGRKQPAKKAKTAVPKAPHLSPGSPAKAPK